MLMWFLILFLYQKGGFDMICSGRDKIETPEQVGCFFCIFLTDLLLLPKLCAVCNCMLSHMCSLNKLKKQQRS